MFKILIGALTTCIAITVFAQDNRVDIIRHDAPELASFGEHDIGVRTLVLTDPNRPDVLNSLELGKTVYYDRKLTVEVWYPALLDQDQSAGGQYTTTTRNTSITATLHGRAVRDAAALKSAGAMPLIIISHGYPGNRYLMSHLGENLASKGYLVAAIDHRDSTYNDQQAVASSFYNRPLDQLFVLDHMSGLSDDSNSFLGGMVDAENTGVVGYSMGGYGLVINLGGGYSEALVAHEEAPPNELANRHAAANPDFHKTLDPRIKAGFAIAPWGMADGVWNPDDLNAIEVPTFYLTGSLDMTAGYEDGTRAIFENSLRSDRYLLTFINAGHNAIAPIPLPVEIANSEDKYGASHYTDPVWDSIRTNNIMDHFATAFFDFHLKGKNESLAYLDLVPNAHDGIYSVEEDVQTEAHTYWKGFSEGTARGLILEHRESAE
jgi:predicted dienelactone hydrolase